MSSEVLKLLNVATEWGGFRVLANLSKIRNNFFTYNLNENYYYTDYVDIVLVKFGELMEAGDAWIPELQEIIKNFKED